MRTFSLILALLLGACFPQLHILSPAIRFLLIAMLFVTFLKIDVKELTPRFRHLLIILANLLLAPIVWFLLRAIGLPDLAIPAFFIAISPTATNAPVVLGFLGAQVEFGVTCLILTNAAVCLAIPIFLPLFSNEPSAQLATELATSMITILGIPAVLAFLTRKFISSAKRWPAKLASWQFGAWNFTLIIIAARGSHYILENSLPFSTALSLAALAIALCSIQFFFGGFLARPLKVEGAQSLGQKNTILTLYIAITHDFPLAALALTFYVLCHNTWNAWQLFQFAKAQKLATTTLHEEEEEIYAEES